MLKLHKTLALAAHQTFLKIIFTIDHGTSQKWPHQSHHILEPVESHAFCQSSASSVEIAHQVTPPPLPDRISA